MDSGKLVASAAERNKKPILEVLNKVIPEKFGDNVTLSALEIGSGTGQHIVYFASGFPKVHWQPSDVDKSCLLSCTTYIKEAALSNVIDPVFIDITKKISEWEKALSFSSLDIVITINLLHITKYETVPGLFSAAASLLRPGGILVIYGPFAVKGKISPESNVLFDVSLKDKNPEFGLRDIDDLESEGRKNGLIFDAMFDMPANNKTLVFYKL